MSFNEQLPQWENLGAEPPSQKKSDGWTPDEKPPADWFNWLFNRAYKCIQEIRTFVIGLAGAGRTTETVKGNADDIAALDDTVTSHLAETTQAHGGIVPSSRTVNGKTLNANISLAKSDVGLGSVENYGIATQAEAEEGTSNDKYMTPLRVKQAINKEIAPVFYYDTGNEFNAITGGWVVGYSTFTGTQSKEATYLNLTTNYGARTYVTNNLIDLATIKKLYIEWEQTGTGTFGCEFIVGTVKTDKNFTSEIVFTTNFTKRIDTLDVTALTGQYYLKAITQTIQSSTSTLKVHRIWGEK